MKNNVGTADRVIRILAALLLVVLYTTNTVTGPLSTVLLIISVVLLLTGIMQVCPIYYILKINTKQNKSKQL